MKRKAFTLAEVLITLGVIGVVASMTLPTLIQKQQKMVWVNQLKKAYSIISQVTQRMMVDDGVEIWGNTQFYSYFTNDNYDELKSLAGEYFKANKICVSSESGCVPEQFSEYKYFNGSKASLGPLPLAGLENLSRSQLLIFLSDGSIIVVNMSIFAIDVNGLKGPNVYGRDVFLLAIETNEGKVKPLYDWQDGACNVTGWNCAKDIIEAGWKMNY